MAGFFKGKDEQTATENVELEELKSSLAKLSEQMEELNKKQERIDELETANSRLITEISDLKDIVANLDKELKLLDTSTDSTLAEKVELNIKNFGFQIQQLHSQIENTLRDEQRKLQTTLEDEQRKIDKQISEVKVKADYAVTKSESNDMKRASDIAELTQKVNDIKHDVNTLSSEIVANADAVKNQIAFYSDFFTKNFTEIFGQRFIKDVKADFLREVRQDARSAILEAGGEYLKSILTDYLKDSIRHEVVVGLSGKKEIGKDALEAIVDTVTENVVGEIVKEIDMPTAQAEKGGKAGKINVAANLSTQAQEPLSKKEHKHQEFEHLLGLLQVGLHPMLVGPAGTGKSTAAMQAARALGLPFYSANRVSNAYELTGFLSAGGEYMPTQFYEAYSKGGVFLFDEIDASDPEALVTFNNALASDYMCFPCGMVKKHKDFKVVAAGNTFGVGADAEYTGRNPMDAATRNRFVVLEWDYDRELEKEICKDKELLRFCWDLRSICEKNHFKIIIGTRDINYFQKALQAKGIDLPDAIKITLLEGVNIDTIKTIKGGLINMKNYPENSKFIKALDTIVERDYKKQTERNM